MKLQLKSTFFFHLEVCCTQHTSPSRSCQDDDDDDDDDGDDDDDDDDDDHDAILQL